MTDDLESALKKLATIELTEAEIAALDAFLNAESEVDGFGSDPDSFGLDPSRVGVDPARFGLDPASLGVLAGRRSTTSNADRFHGPPGTGKT